MAAVALPFVPNVVGYARHGAQALEIGARLGGRLGGLQHRAKVAEVAAEYANKGFEIIAGGGRAERARYAANGARRFPDIIAARDGAEVYINVGRLTQGGDLVGREARALDDLATIGFVDFRPF